jgi:hypothetical protein
MCERERERESIARQFNIILSKTLYVKIGILNKGSKNRYTSVLFEARFTVYLNNSCL